MCLTNFDNVNTTYCFSCKQRIGNLGELCITRAKSQTRDLCRDQRDWTGPNLLFPVRFVFRDSLRTCSVVIRLSAATYNS